MTTLTIKNLRRAAIAQDWAVEQTSQGHLKFIPPDKNKRQIVTSGTPSDYRAINNFLSDLRRSGCFSWPWPPPNFDRRSTMANVGSAGNLGGVLAGVSISPERSTESEESPMTTPTTTTPMLNGHGTEPEIEWVPVVVPERLKISSGYRISELSECRAPSGRALKRRQDGNQLYVNLTRSDRREFTLSVRVDKLMLWSFYGEPREGEVETPVHEDGDTLNCRLDNLSWRQTENKPAQRPRPAPKFEVDESLEIPADDDDIRMEFESHGVTVKYTTDSGWTISPCTGLSDQQFTSLGRAIDRCRNFKIGL
jgi:hypothetical protein